MKNNQTIKNITGRITDKERNELYKSSTVHIVDDFYDRELIDAVNKRYLEAPTYYLVRTFNLFNVRKWNIQDHEELNSMFEAFTKRIGMKTRLLQVVRYGEGAFAKMHKDSIDVETERGTFTCLTTLKQAELGGEHLIAENYSYLMDSHIYKDKNLSRKEKMHIGKPKSKSVTKINMENVCIRALRTNSRYQTAIIPDASKTEHGVSKVEKGMRIVLIHWMVPIE